MWRVSVGNSAMLRPGLAALSLDVDPGSTLVLERTTATDQDDPGGTLVLERPALSRAASFDVSQTDTFNAERDGASIRLHGARGMEKPGSSSFIEYSSIELDDLERGPMVGKGASGRGV